MHGFTLFEVLVSLLLVAFAFLGIDAVFTHGLQQERAQMYSRQAYLLADNMSRYMSAHLSEHVNYDVVWQQQIAAALPQGRGEIDESRREIHIAWGEAALTCKQQQLGISGCIKLALSPK